MPVKLVKPLPKKAVFDWPGLFKVGTLHKQSSADVILDCLNVKLIEQCFSPMQYYGYMNSDVLFCVNLKILEGKK